MNKFIALGLGGSLMLCPGHVFAGDGGREHDLFYYQTTVSADTTALSPMQKTAYSARDKKSMVREMASLLEHHHLRIVDDPTDAARLTVRLAWVDAKTSIYSVELTVAYPDGSTKKLDTFRCACMDTEEIAAELSKRIPQLLVMLERPDNVPDGATDSSDEGPATPVTNKEAKAGPLAFIGTGLMVGGAISTIIGAVYLNRGTRSASQSGDDGFSEDTRYKPTGATALGVGGAVLLTGIGFVLVDQLVLKQKRKSRNVSVLPTFRSVGAGISITGRF